ncbi:MAG: LamG domain-containing protein [Bacteroidales bacterium]|nr:LamG domain-containing protein [Bacteroidales bacterium]MDZ4205337.1 LamG domain-containing protein [Bacteroidales bacterium]
MKNLMKLQTLLLMLIVSSVMILGSCKKDDPIVEGDKTALNALIVQADVLAAGATPSAYPQTAIDNFKAVLATVKTAAATKLTQVEINNLVTQLTEAMATFRSQAYGYINEALNLNAGWHFDEGTGTTATAFSTVKHVATFVKGNVALLGADAMLPTWVTGVKGGNAVLLNKGANLQVPYTTSFLPVDISISVWIKPTELYEHNYIISQNYWQGYKLQTQGGGKPFFTYKSTKAVDPIINADNEMDHSIRAGFWNHIVITLNGTTKELKFYVDGTLTKTWTEATKGIAPLIQTLTNPAPQPFIIGCVATDAEVAANMSWATADNHGYFKGAIDELKIYNIALTDGQVSKLYNDEKP